VGLFEKAKNITDTELRLVVADSDDPSEALRRHILSLEESQRQLRTSQGVLKRQRDWLESGAERKLALAEEWEKRAVTAARKGRDDLARHALVRKKELLRSMSDDRRQLEHLLPQLEEVEGRLGEVRQKVLKARAARARFFEGNDVESAEAADSAGPPPESSRFREPPPLKLTEREQRELDEELRDLKRRFGSDAET